MKRPPQSAAPRTRLDEAVALLTEVDRRVNSARATLAKLLPLRLSLISLIDSELLAQLTDREDR